MRTFSLGAGADVVKFTSASSADANTITNFGTDTVKDKLSFDKTNVFKVAGTASSFDNASIANIASNKVYKGTAEQIKAIKSSDNSGTSLGTTFAIATDTGDIYAVTDTGKTGETVITDVIGNVGTTAATAITSGTFNDFIVLA